MKKVEFRTELSQEAMNIYSDSSFAFYQDEEGFYYASDCVGQEAFKIGTLEDVEKYLLTFAE